MPPTKEFSSGKQDGSKPLLNHESYKIQEMPSDDVVDLQDQNLAVDPGQHNELFAQDQSASSKPWWNSNFFVSEPVLFGTWDGVFTSCMINLFGVIIFLRAGWVVAEAGIVWSVVIVLTAVLLILLSVLSGIGICERCVLGRGGIYFVLSHILGARLGASMGILYCFGQAVSAALHSIGFGESIGILVGIDNIWVQRAIAASLLLFLVGVNVTGVVWVVKLQFILLLAMLLAALDFFVGSCVRTNPSLGVDGYYSDNFYNNSASAYTEGNNLFTVFGVFFPALTGIFAGINMSGDLRNPSKNISEGTLSSLGVCCILYLAFVMILGATCRRSELLANTLIAEKVSAIGVLFLCGLYTSSVSSCLGTLYGTPRILQSIANENVIPALCFLGKGRGPNKIPVVGICVVAFVTLLFILVGDINSLAPVVTVPFLMTYAAINYAYFSLSMSIDMQNIMEQKFRSDDDEALTGILSDKPGVHHYGTTSKNNSVESPSRDSDDDDKLMDNLNDYTGNDLAATIEVDMTEQQLHQQENSDVPGTLPLLVDEMKTKPHRTLPQDKPWYYKFSNRWVALLTTCANIFLMFFVQWLYALILSLVWLVLHVYTGKANSGSSPGISNFKFCQWILRLVYKLCGKSRHELVLRSLSPSIGIRTSQLTQDNDDFAGRKRYHRASISTYETHRPE